MKATKEQLIKARDDWFAKMQSVFDGTYNSDRPFILNGVLSKGKSDPYTEPEKWIDECIEDVYNRLADKILDEGQFVPVCLEYGIYGVHYVDRMFGAEVYYADGQWNAKYIDGIIGELQEPDLEHDETFQLSIRAAKYFVSKGDDFILFGLPTIASPLNIAVNLYGQTILLAMIEEPERVRHDLEVIANTLVKIHQAFRDILPYKQLQPVISWGRTQPPLYGQICGCTTQLVSEDDYHDLVADLDERVLNVYPNGGMIHLCGRHTQHINTFREMKALKAIQVNDRAAHDLERYFNELRDDQIIYLNPCEGMTAERALEITKGKRLIIAGNFDLSYRI